MPLTTQSVLRSGLYMDPVLVEDLIHLTIDQVGAKYQQDVGDEEWIIRDLKPSDLGETNEVWAETITAAGNAYQNSQISSQSTADMKVIGIYGVLDLSYHQWVSAIRITGGAAVRAEWSLFPFLGALDSDLKARTGFAMTPIILGENTPIKVEYYVRAGWPQQIRGVELVLLGVTAEKRATVLEG